MIRLFAALLALLSVHAHGAMMGNNGWDWEARNWNTNIVTSGGTISGGSYFIGTKFMHAIKRWGLRTRIGRANLYLGDNTNAMTCPIIVDWSGGGVINDDLIAFAAADYTEATGLTGDGSTKYLRCSKSPGFTMNSFTSSNSVHQAAYVRTGSNAANDIMGAGGVTGTWGLAISNGGQTYVFMGANVTSAADSNGTGMCLSTRTATNNAVTYRNAAVIVTDAVHDTGTIGGEANMVHAINISGAVLAHTARTLSYYAFGFSIPAAQVSAYNIAVQNVQRAVGRAVP